MRRIAQKLTALAQRMMRPWIKKGRWRAIAIDEVPDSFQHQCLYLIGEGAPWAAACLCPCGCGEVINLSLLEEDSPSWKLSFDRDGLPTLSPSIWRTKGCRSHFFLRRGRVVWCGHIRNS